MRSSNREEKSELNNPEPQIIRSRRKRMSSLWDVKPNNNIEKPTSDGPARIRQVGENT